MIVKMFHLDIVCMGGEGEKTLEELRKLGAVHLDLGRAQGAEVAEAKGEAADAEKAVRLILKAREELKSLAPREDAAAGGAAKANLSGAKEVLAAAAARDSLAASADALEKEIRRFEPYGDFDPALAKRLLDELGDDLRKVAELPEELPPKSLGEMRADLESARREMAAIGAQIASADDKSIVAEYPALADRVAFSAAKELLEKEGAVEYISGWVAVPRSEEIRAAARANGWGILMREPAAGEIPPTLIEPPRLFRPVKALFDGLGISPAYTEADVSVPFMCYFSLFFAMLVGDGAYGAIFLAATLWGWFKWAKSADRSPVAKSWLVLLTVFSSATVAWGALSNTWFGANIPACASWPTVKWLADPSYHNMMLLCFTIGASHLVLARLWNAVCKAPDSTALAEVGWAGVLVMMYLVTNSIVGIFSKVPTWGIVLGAVSIVLVFGFSVKPAELKTRGAELGMLPLNIMSALGDIISYVRLFAVGLASVKVAENFNSMATGLVAGADAIWLKALMSVAMVAILVVGHGLNLAMAGLSILVHAVRLNTLEFSNHKGVSWAGYAFRPFRRN